jgi:predicted double-glycine peptidase
MIIDMPSGRQTFNFDCGAKVLQLVFAYYGIDIREDRLIEELACDDNGTLVKNMKEAAERRGFRVLTTNNTTLEAVKRYIDDKRPVIVLVQAWVDREMTMKEWRQTNEYGHYVIVIGYEDDRIIFEDPASFPKTWMTGDEFLARWHYLDGRINRTVKRFSMVLLGKEPTVTKRLDHMD